MPKGIRKNPIAVVAAAGGTDKTAATDKTSKLEARLAATETKVELLLKGLYAGHAAATKALPKQRPGRQPRATAAASATV